MIDTTALPPEERAIIEARRAYKKNWRNNNKEKIQQHNKRFYEKVAERISAEKAGVKNE